MVDIDDGTCALAEMWSCVDDGVAFWLTFRKRTDINVAHTRGTHSLDLSCTLCSPLIGSRSLLINPHGLFPATHQ
jgi:hypothetical protein